MKTTTSNIIKATLDGGDEPNRIPAEPCATFPLPSVPLTGQVNGGGNVSLLHQRKYGVPEAAKLLGVSETNLRAIIRAGRLPVLKVTKAKVLILEKDLEAFLQDRHVTIKEKDIRPPSKTPPPPDFVVNSEHLKRKAS